MRIVIAVEEIERTNAALGDVVGEAGYHCAWKAGHGGILLK